MQVRVTEASEPVNVLADEFAGGRSFPYSERLAISAMARCCCSGSDLEACMVKKIPTRLEKHGHVRMDDYYWLRERDNPEVMTYLNAENDYAAKTMAHTDALQQ